MMFLLASWGKELGPQAGIRRACSQEFWACTSLAGLHRRRPGAQLNRRGIVQTATAKRHWLYSNSVSQSFWFQLDTAVGRKPCPTEPVDGMIQKGIMLQIVAVRTAFFESRLRLESGAATTNQGHNYMPVGRVAGLDIDWGKSEAVKILAKSGPQLHECFGILLCRDQFCSSDARKILFFRN